MDILKQQAAKITSLEIQGATNIALFAIKIFNEFIQRHKDDPKPQLWRKILEVEKIIIATRATEPTMRNGLLYITGKILEEKNKNGKTVDIGVFAAKFAKEYISLIDESTKKIAEIGARRITEGTTIMTHCHSSIVEAIFIKAFQDGKKFEVVCTETRPKFQGRITATHLKKAGLNVKMVVDSGMRWAVKTQNVSAIFIGADAITSEGTVMNKIGSRLLALVADEENIPFYVASPLFKYNIETLSGSIETIERRDPNEVWSEKESLHLGTRPEGLDILNPAFETVARKYIDGIICEAGLFPAEHVHLIFEKKYPFLVNGNNMREDEFD